MVILLTTYFGYPLCLMILSKILAKKTKIDDCYEPLISIIIPSYNEGAIIGRKIKNSLHLNYPKNKLEIIIASDGSTDNTRKIVEEYLTCGIKYYEFPRAGKLATINSVFPCTRGEILILTDANVMLDRDAVKKLLRHFADESVGVVTGIEKIKRQKSGVVSLFEKDYWNYENNLKYWEGKIYSTVGANGPIYAIRRDLFSIIPSNLNLCDDLAISLSVVQKGKRILLDPEATAFEDAAITPAEEWSRKKRIATRAWQALLYHKNLLFPFKSPIALPLLFHKVLRWCTLPLLVILLISNFFLRGNFYNIFLVMQLLFHITSIIGLVFLWYNIKIVPFVLSLGYFLFTTLAQVIGLYNVIFKKSKPIWQPIRRF